VSKIIKVLSKEESQVLSKKIKEAKITTVVKMRVKTVQSKAEKDRILKEKYRKMKLKEIADSYEFHDPCGHIKSVKNGII